MDQIHSIRLSRVRVKVTNKFDKFTCWTEFKTSLTFLAQFGKMGETINRLCLLAIQTNLGF
jgi:hypothetical protein